MKINKLFILAPISVLALATSCGAAKRYDVKDYQLTLEWKNTNFNILQLTDLHISNASDNEKHFNFIKETVRLAKEEVKKNNEDIDLIVITGDMFTFAGKSEVIELFNFFDSLKVNWSCTFGNHDEQAYFPVDWLTGTLNDLNAKREKDKSSYCVFKDLQDDDVFGNANYVINLKKENALKEQIYIFDSNRYNFGEYRGYDYIHYDQIDWYERQLNSLTGTDKNVKSLAFFHIPFPDFEDNYKHALNKEKGCQFVAGIPDNQGHDTSCGIPKKNTGLYDVMKKHGNTNGVFVGHDHTSTYVVDQTFNDGNNHITLAFGIKGTSNVYCDPTKLGGQIIKIDNNGEFKISRIYHEYAK